LWTYLFIKPAAMPPKRAVRKRAPSSTAVDDRVAKKGKNEARGEESEVDDSPAGDSTDEGDDSSSFAGDEEDDDDDDESAEDDESAAPSDDSDPPAKSRRASRNAPASRAVTTTATPRKRGRPSAGAAAPAAGEERSTLAPGLEVRFKRPQARKAGGTPYMDETIHPNTFLFLADLAANNDREWLKCELVPFRALLVGNASWLTGRLSERSRLSSLIGRLSFFQRGAVQEDHRSG
jgi:hypothetical protein